MQLSEEGKTRTVFEKTVPLITADEKVEKRMKSTAESAVAEQIAEIAESATVTAE
jgi:hypothetical protein